MRNRFPAHYHGQMSKAIQFLTNTNIPFRLFFHTSQPISLEEAARQRKQSVYQVVRSILFRTPKSSYIMVLAPGPKQISWKSLRDYLHVRRISLATPEEVRTVTGYLIGTVTPFGIPSSIRLIADISLKQMGEISIGSGQQQIAVILNASEMFSVLPNVEFLSLNE